MILGLGITRLLSSVVEVFRSRHRAELDWVPFVWSRSRRVRVVITALYVPLSIGAALMLSRASY
jgi:hypothetical protein